MYLIHLVFHDDDKFVKLDGAVVIGVRVADGAQDLDVSRVVTHGPDDLAQLPNGNLAVPVRVKKVERFPDSLQLRFGQFVNHF